jgi:hypothetical protein
MTLQGARGIRAPHAAVWVRNTRTVNVPLDSVQGRAIAPEAT